jgi:hypothetical protein
MACILVCVVISVLPQIESVHNLLYTLKLLIDMNALQKEE